jgi:membrane protein DedA with SNARE-associated domain
MPWKGKPGRQDLLCWGGFSLTGVYSLVSLPFRPLLLASNPILLCALTGSRTAVVTVGALAAVGRMDWWWVGLILATLSVLKFDPLFWWAGRLWGRGLIEIIAGRSARAARSADRAERLAERFGVLAMLLTYVVPVVPRAVVYASVGAAGMRLRTFLLVDFLGSLATRCLYLYLGYRIGQPAVDIFDTIAKYSLYVSLALVVVVFVSVVRQQRSKAAPVEHPQDH